MSKHIGGHGNALGGAVTDTGLYDWSDYPNIAEPYRKGKPTTWGLTQIKKKGLRDMGGTLSAEAAHRIAAGAETLATAHGKVCSNALALAQALKSASQGGQSPLSRSAGPCAARARRRICSAIVTARLMGIELVDEIDVFDFLNRLRVLILATHLGDNRTLVLPMAHTIYYEMGAERRAYGYIRQLLARVRRHRGHAGFDRRFCAGAANSRRTWPYHNFGRSAHYPFNRALQISIMLLCANAKKSAIMRVLRAFSLDRLAFKGLIRVSQPRAAL